MTGHISPEAASGGPIAFIKTGDIIEYSCEKRTLNVIGIDGKLCSAQEIDDIFAKRKDTDGIVPRPPRKGLYKRYTESALSAMQGAGY